MWVGWGNLDRTTMAGAEYEGQQRISTLGDGEVAGVVRVVVVRAQTDQVAVISATTLRPVLYVVNLDESRRSAPRIGAPAIAILDHAAQPVRDRALRSADATSTEPPA